MKKFFLSLFISSVFIFNIFTSTVFANDSYDLKFSPVGEGKYIYCNNPERISRNNLSDMSNRNPSYIMNNENLTTGKYSVNACHLNRTELRDRTGAISEAGFDIELDIQFKAKEDTKLILTAVGFSTPQKEFYRNEGDEKWTLFQTSWECMQTLADYMQRPIYQINSYKSHIPNKFEPVEIDIKKGQEMWLSRYISNYSTVTWMKSVHILTDFEIISGSIDLNIAALRANSNLGDRNNHDNEASYGIYYRDRQYKGIADTLPEVYSQQLQYTIDDNTEDGTVLPVTVYNQYKPDGNTVTSWFTHINPHEDIWARNSTAESDMLTMKYRDPLKLTYYGKNIDESEKSDIWTFDVFHSDTKTYNSAQSIYGIDDYSPNYRLRASGNNVSLACNLANYDIKTNYRISVTNNGQNTRYFNYKLDTTSNNVVSVKDENGNYIDSYSICKGSNIPKKQDVMACIELPPNETTSFMIEILLPINYPGGMQNSFEISDTKTEFKFLEDDRQKNVLEQKYTGKEYIKWVNGNIYTSVDKKNWEEHILNAATKRIFDGIWDDFDIKSTSDGYIARFAAYDAGPAFYRTAMVFYKDIYILDKDFNLVSKHSFDNYVTDMSHAKGVYYAESNGRHYSLDGKKWNVYDSVYSFPIDNGGKFSIKSKDKQFYISSDGENYSKISYTGNTPEYIDIFNSMYYYVDGKNLNISKDAIYWNTIEFLNKIEKLEIDGNEFLVNDSERFSIPDLKYETIVKLNGDIISFDIAPLNENGRLLVPMRAIFEKIGAQLNWDESTNTANIAYKNNRIDVQIDNSTAYMNNQKIEMEVPARHYNGYTLVPLRFLSEALDFDIAAVGTEGTIDMVIINTK